MAEEWHPKRPDDDAELSALRAEVVRLNKVVAALMDRAERDMSAHGSHFGLFQTTVMLEGQVRSRTRELEAALRENEKVNRELQRAKARMEETHFQLLQSEKLAAIGQLAAGVAHEINNPIGFIGSNLGSLKGYVKGLIGVIEAYEAAEPHLAEHPALAERIAEARKAADLEYVRQDCTALIDESIDGTDRVRRIVQDLRDFSRSDDAEWAPADLHRGLDSTLNVVRNEIKYKAEVVREYGDLPEVECLYSQINQVFMNLLVNAAQAIPEHGTITIRTGAGQGQAWVAVSDDGAGMTPETAARIFDPFFTTKPVGKGTGLGLSLAYGIVDKHGGRIEVKSRPGEGSTFTVYLPVRRPGGAEPKVGRGTDA